MYFSPMTQHGYSDGEIYLRMNFSKSNIWEKKFTVELILQFIFWRSTIYLKVEKNRIGIKKHMLKIF